MTTYAQMTTEELQSELASLQDAYNGFKAKGRKDKKDSEGSFKKKHKRK